MSDRATASARRIAVIAKVPEDLRAALIAEFDLIDCTRGAPAQEHRAGIRVALTTSMGGAPPELLDSLPDLSAIVCHGAGLDRFDGPALDRRGLVVRNTPDVVTDDTADMAVALVYATARQIVSADAFVRAGRWPRERITPSRRVFGKRAGIVGLGKIGRAVADRLSGAGLSVCYTGPWSKPGVSYEYIAAVEDLARKVDLLILTCSASEATRHMINADVLRTLGPEGFLINVARGSIVQEDALIAALQTGDIAGAGLDVYEDEPEIDPQFMTLKTAVLQPHAATITFETRQAMIAMIQRLCREALEGYRP